MQQLIDRYLTLLGPNPAPPGTIRAVEAALGVTFPADLKQIARVCSGPLGRRFGHLRLAAEPGVGTVVGATRLQRDSRGLPPRFVVLEKEPFLTTLLATEQHEDAAARVVRVFHVPQQPDPIRELGRTGQLPGTHPAFDSYAAYFALLLDEFEEHRELRQRYGEEPPSEKGARRVAPGAHPTALGVLPYRVTVAYSPAP